MKKNELKDVILVRLANFPLGEIGHLDCRGKQRGVRSGAALIRYICGSSSLLSPHCPLLPTGHLFVLLHFSILFSSNYSLLPYFLHVTRNSEILMSVKSAKSEIYKLLSCKIKPSVLYILLLCSFKDHVEMNKTTQMGTRRANLFSLL